MRILYYLIAAYFLMAATATAGFFDFLKGEPSLSDEQKEWKLYQPEFGAKQRIFYAISFSLSPELNTTGHLVVRQDGYKMIRCFRTEIRTNASDKPTMKNMVEWGWKVTISNVAAKDMGIKNLTYKLYDKDLFVIATATKVGGFIKAGNTIVIQDTSELEYDQIDRVTSSSVTVVYDLHKTLDEIREEYQKFREKVRQNIIKKRGGVSPKSEGK